MTRGNGGEKRAFDALSLDLAETLLWDTPELSSRSTDARNQILSRIFRKPDGTSPSVEEIVRVREGLEAEWVRSGRPLASIRPTELIATMGVHLGAQRVVPEEEAVAAYASAGLRENPPFINPEAPALFRALEEIGIPVVGISNSQRSGHAWQSHLQESAGLRFTGIVTSSDLGVCKPDPWIFQEAARCVRVPPPRILHVGDRWRVDVQGARGAGMSAALYRGLWSHYWTFWEGGAEMPPEDAHVPCLDHLGEILPLLGFPEERP